MSIGAGRPQRLSGTPDSPRWRGWLHLGALVAAAPAAAALVARHPTRVAVVVYAVSLVALYALSSAYHLLPMSGRARRWVRRADHAYIYVFIAASSTPLCLIAIPPVPGEALLGLIWLGAAVGVTIKLTGFQRARRVGGSLYIVLGWLVVVALPDVVRALDATQLVLCAVMGLLYTAGYIVLATRRPDPAPETFGYHEVWHAMVVVASACYYVVVWSLASVHT